MALFDFLNTALPEFRNPGVFHLYKSMLGGGGKLSSFVPRAPRRTLTHRSKLICNSLWSCCPVLLIAIQESPSGCRYE